MTPERVAELRAILTEGDRTDRPMKNFMNIYDAANGLSEALDAVERVRAVAAEPSCMADDEDWTNGWKSAMCHILAALEGKSDG